MPAKLFVQDCTLCNADSESAMDEKMSHQASVCVDPDCPQSVCDECSDPEECCQECVQEEGTCEDCTGHQDCCEECVEGGCSILDLIDCAGRHCEYHKDYVCDGSCFELFGDQATEMFGHGALPELPMDTTAGNSTSTWSGMPSAWKPSINMAQHSMAPSLVHESSYGALRESAGILMQAAAASTVAVNARETVKDSLFKPSHFGDYTSQKQYSSDLAQAGMNTTGHAPSKSPTHRFVTCQWANQRGEPCGEIFGLGDELHEHLKVAHNIKNEVFCRWLGCQVGNHRYANGVQRHTWGHSGYRPYKCPECSEGFAAAAVRDEHIANIHMKKKIFACDVCNHQCTSATNLKRHKDEKHKSERFQCEFCNRHGKRTLFPRGPNLARHFRKCKFVLAQYPEADGAVRGKINDDWFPPGYRRGHHGMNKAKVTPPNYLPVP